MTNKTTGLGTQQLILIAGIGVLAWWLFSPIATLLYTLFLAMLVAYVLDPILDWGEAKKIPRTVTICGILLALAVFGLGFAFWIIPPLIEHIHEAVVQLTSLSEKKLPQWITWLEATTGITVENAGTLAKAQISKYGPIALQKVGQWSAIQAGTTLGALSNVVYLISFPLFVFYLARDFDRIVHWLSRLIPVRHRDGVSQSALAADSVIGEWLRGQAQVAGILALFYSVTLLLAGIPLGFPIGILAGLLSVIPYLGGAIGLGLALLMALLTLDGGLSALYVLGIFGVANVLEGYILTPKIVGEKVGLPPLAVLVALLIGGEWFGIFGVLIAVPVAGVIKVFGSELLAVYRQSKAFTAEAEDVVEEVSNA